MFQLNAAVIAIQHDVRLGRNSRKDGNIKDANCHGQTEDSAADSTVRGRLNIALIIGSREQQQEQQQSQAVNAIANEEYEGIRDEVNQRWQCTLRG